MPLSVTLLQHSRVAAAACPGRKQRLQVAVWKHLSGLQQGGSSKTAQPPAFSARHCEPEPAFSGEAANTVNAAASERT
jgi:hypothetical protein